MPVIIKSLKTNVILLLAARLCSCDDHSCITTVPGTGSSFMQRSRDISPKPPDVQRDFTEVYSSSEFDVDDHKGGSEEDSHKGFIRSGMDFVRLASRMSARARSSTGLLFCKSHPCSLMLTEKSDHLGKGQTASLTEDGYARVVVLRDDNEMKSFILRVIQKLDCQVVDDGGLMGIVPWFSGTTSSQSLEKLEDVLLFAIMAEQDPWIVYKNTGGTTGSTAPLNDQGYIEVACLRRVVEMQNFGRRLCEKAEVEITDQAGFNRMIDYYNESASFHSFDLLRSEILAAAAASTWAKFK